MFSSLHYVIKKKLRQKCIRFYVLITTESFWKSTPSDKHIINNGKNNTMIISLTSFTLKFNNFGYFIILNTISIPKLGYRPCINAIPHVLYTLILMLHTLM